MKYRTNFTLSINVLDFDDAQDYLSEDNMENYLKQDDRIDINVRNKVETITWNLTSENKGYIELITTSELTTEDLKSISKWVSGQNSDGLGEGFEQQHFASYSETDYYLEHEGYSLSEVNEMEDNGEISSNYRYCSASFDWRTNDYIFEKYED